MPDHDVTVRATFALMYTVAIDGDITHSSVSANKASAVAGDTVTLTVAPAAGFGLESLTYAEDGGEPVAITGNAFTMPAGDVTVRATFALMYTVAIDEDITHGTVTADKATTIEGETVSLTVEPANGYALSSLTYTPDGGQATDITEAKSFTMPASDVTVTATFTQSGPAIKGHVLQLNGVLGLKFYVALPEGFEPAGSRITFTINGGTQTVSFSESRTEHGYYYFPCQVRSFQMADEITAAYIWGDGADECVSKTYSVQQYQTYFNEHADSYPAVVVDLAHAMQNYGHYVQPYLARANHWTVGTDHAEMPKYSDVDTDVDASAYALNISVKTGIVENSIYSLSLDANTALNVYLTLNDDSVTALTAQIDDRTPYTISRRSDGTFRIICSGIEGNNLGKNYLFTVKNGDETIFQANISALSFVNTVLNKSTHTDDTEVEAVCALYWYAKTADAYATSLTN